MGKLFVWDFHGTMETGNDEAVREYTNSVLKQHGYARRLTVREAEFLTGRRWCEYFTYLLPDEPMTRCLELEKACIDMVASMPEIVARHIKPNYEVHEVLRQITSAGHDQIVISNSQPEAMRMFLDVIRIGHFFPPGKSVGIADGKEMTKRQVLDGIVNGRCYSAIVAVGDNEHDMIGTANYLYAHDGREHKPCRMPHIKIRSLRSILREL